MKRDLFLVGGGGHCRSCIDVIEQLDLYRIAGIVDVAAKLNEQTLGYTISATDEDLPRLVGKDRHFLITLGQIRTPDRRIFLFNKLKALGAALPVIVSPLAHVSRHARIGEGTIVMHHALINPGAIIGRNCIVNSGALIEHDAQAGDHCHIATRAVLNGGVTLGEGTFIGSNAVCREGVTIGAGAVIGCQARILKDVPAGATVK
jgi:sugar O-acyltransferase (sialic acid O-acetyltransferase NeuD family)